jgi:hypothetical protein
MGDMTAEIKTNPQVRERAMNAIASDGELAVEMTRTLLANDSLRVRVVETVLREDKSAQYILARIGHEPDAVDLVLQAAAADSAGRAHLMTLLKGMQIGMGKK